MQGPTNVHSNTVCPEFISISTLDIALEHVVNYRLLTAKNRALFQVIPCGLYGGQIGTRAGQSVITSAFLSQYLSTNTPYASVYASDFSSP